MFTNDNGEKVRIYVNLLDEGLEVKRPIWAKKLGDNLYEVLDIDYVPEVEIWEFIPGDIVECKKDLDKNIGEYFLAV